jgi:hypothetical protein
MLAAAWFGLPSRDINATPKILRTELIRQLKLREKNIGLDLEILIQLKQRAMSWLEIPAPSHKRTFGTSTTKVKTVWEMIAAMSRLALRHKF